MLKEKSSMGRGRKSRLGESAMQQRKRKRFDSLNTSGISSVEKENLEHVLKCEDIGERVEEE